MSDATETKGANPYGSALPVKHDGAGVAVAASRAASEVQAQVFLARQYPRDPVRATDNILAECDIYELAKAAIYSYPRAGTQVEGASIRLAEVLKRHWGNMISGIVEVDRAGSESSMLAYAWDLETNAMSRKEFKVAHVRDSNRGGKQNVTEERDIYEVAANAGSRRERACILALIPGHVVNAALDRCKNTLTAKIGNPAEAAEKMLEAFEVFKVTKVQIEKRLRHRLETINAAEVIALRGVYTAIRDGYADASDYFEAEEGGAPPPPATTAEKARAAAKAATGKPQAAPPKPEPGSIGAQQAQQVAGVKDVIASFIGTNVPVPDRPWYTESLEKAKTLADLGKLREELESKYYDPA